MAIVQTLTQGQFIEAFKQSSRASQFSYEALEAIFNHIEELSDDLGEPVEFDMVAICCEWSEMTWQEIAEQYSVDLSDCEDDDERIEAVEYHLNEQTVGVYRMADDSFVFVAF
jgi:predicted ArsR family transcriptional regulator